MKLFGTAPSHFTRKVRVVLQELALPCEMVPIENLMDLGPEHFGQNPLHQIPVLEDGARRLIESDLICEYLLEKHGKPSSPVVFLPRGDRFEQLTRLAVMNGGMASGVKIMRARRSAIPQFERFAFFQQDQASIEAALRWLEKDLGQKIFYDSGVQLSLLDVTLMCFADWVLFREMVPNLNPYPNIARFVAAHRERPSFVRTHPAREFQ